jgi:hypothetical protein
MPIPRNMMLVVTIMALLLLASTTTAAASVPLLYCANESADPDECQLELESARLTLRPWFDEHDRLFRHSRQLLDCRRFCRREKYLTFQLPCQCVSDRRRQVADKAPQRSVAAALAVPSLGPLEGPIQGLHSFVDQMSEGRCKEMLAQMKCFVTFVSSYEAKKPPSDEFAGLNFIDWAPPKGSEESPTKSPSTTNVVPASELPFDDDRAWPSRGRNSTDADNP